MGRTPSGMARRVSRRCSRADPRDRHRRPGGRGHGRARVGHPADAIAGAARLLRAAGAPQNYRHALLAYNHANWYVGTVLAKAAEYRGTFAPDATRGIRAALMWAVAHVGR